MRDGVGAVLAKGTDFLLYTIADPIVDGYFPVLDRSPTRSTTSRTRSSSRRPSGRSSGSSR